MKYTLTIFLAFSFLLFGCDTDVNYVRQLEGSQAPFLIDGDTARVFRLNVGNGGPVIYAIKINGKTTVSSTSKQGKHMINYVTIYENDSVRVQQIVKDTVN